MMRFRVLGALEIRPADTWQRIGAAKWRAALAELLVKAGQVVRAEELVLAIWGESVPRSAPALTRKYVMELRRVIGDGDAITLVRCPAGYMLRIDGDETDAGRFERLVRAGRQALRQGRLDRAGSFFAEGLSLWRGPAYLDAPGTTSVGAEIVRLEELRLSTVEARIGVDVACGRSEDLVPELRQLVSSFPLRESLWHLLMRALDAADRPAEALHAYGQASRIIREELGTFPGEALRRLHHTILTGTPAA